MAISAITGTSGLATTTLAAWDFNKRIVAPGNDQGVGTGLDSNRFASAKAYVICSGPSRYTDDNLAAKLTPIGLVQDMSLQQERAIQEVYELGSRAPYYMVGRGTRRLSLSSIVYSGASLLRALYQNSDLSFPPLGSNEEWPAADEQDLFFSNLDSRFFEASMGIYMRIASLADARASADKGADLGTNNQIGGMFLEECYVRAHGLSTGANNTIVAENVVITFARVVPVAREDTLTEVPNIGSA